MAKKESQKQELVFLFKMSHLVTGAEVEDVKFTNNFEEKEK